MTTFKTGDRVVVESPVLAIGGEPRDSLSVRIGERGVVRGAVDGNVLVDFHGGLLYYVHCDGLLKVDDLDRLAAERAPDRRPVIIDPDTLPEGTVIEIESELASSALRPAGFDNSSRVLARVAPGGFRYNLDDGRAWPWRVGDKIVRVFEPREEWVEMPSDFWPELENGITAKLVKEDGSIHIGALLVPTYEYVRNTNVAHFHVRGGTVFVHPEDAPPPRDPDVERAAEAVARALNPEFDKFSEPQRAEALALARKVVAAVNEAKS